MRDKYGVSRKREYGGAEPDATVYDRRSDPNPGERVSKRLAQEILNLSSGEPGPETAVKGKPYQKKNASETPSSTSASQTSAGATGSTEEPRRSEDKNYLGVRLLRGRWVAEICGMSVRGGKRWTGGYNRAEDARAYDTEALKVHGADAETKFPVPPVVGTTAAASTGSADCTGVVVKHGRRYKNKNKNQGCRIVAMAHDNWRWREKDATEKPSSSKCSGYNGVYARGKKWSSRTLDKSFLPGTKKSSGDLRYQLPRNQFPPSSGGPFDVGQYNCSCIRCIQRNG